NRALAPGFFFAVREMPGPKGQFFCHSIQGHKCPCFLQNKNSARIPALTAIAAKFRCVCHERDERSGGVYLYIGGLSCSQSGSLQLSKSVLTSCPSKPGGPRATTFARLWSIISTTLKTSTSPKND